VASCCAAQRAQTFASAPSAGSQVRHGAAPSRQERRRVNRRNRTAMLPGPCMLIAGAIDGKAKRDDVREDHRLRRYRLMRSSSSSSAANEAALVRSRRGLPMSK
jgi:hypothetical protein